MAANGNGNHLPPSHNADNGLSDGYTSQPGGNGTAMDKGGHLMPKTAGRKLHGKVCWRQVLGAHLLPAEMLFIYMV